MGLEAPETQYKTSTNLKARGNLHARYATKNWFAWAAQMMDMPSGGDVLDLGCGAGWFWGSTAAHFPANLSLTLVDQSKGMVAEAISNVAKVGRYMQVSGQVADATKLPFADNSFDRVIAMHMMYHVADPVLAIAEIRRVLRPDGVVYLTTNGDDNFRELYEIWAEAFDEIACDPAAKIFGAVHGAKLLADGFENVEVHHLHDEYAITEGADIYDYLTSFPPGSVASGAQLLALTALIAARFDHEKGIVKVRRSGTLISGRI